MGFEVHQKEFINGVPSWKTAWGEINTKALLSVFFSQTIVYNIVYNITISRQELPESINFREYPIHIAF